MNLISAAALFAGGAMTHADSIVMKPSVRLASSATAVTVGDVAELNGDEAARYRETVIVAVHARDGEIMITVDEVRRALENAGAHWGRIDLNGWRTTVRPTSPLAEAPRAMTGAAIDAKTLHATDESNETPTEFQFIAAQIINARTTAGAIAARITKSLNVDPAHLRLTFAEKDRDLLDKPTDVYRVELEPMTETATNRVTMQARLWKDGVIVDRRAVSMNVELQIAAAYSALDIKRGDLLTARGVQTKPTWIGAGDVNANVTAVTAPGRVARRNIKAGEMLRHNDLDRVTVIERGDLVQVRCLVGGVAIALHAEARGSGAAGDVIEFRKPGERDTFVARVVGRNEAVIDLSK